MSIGIRILSNNLSGLTTNVTFLPQSGGTISLGTQVFPFNYVSDYTYGTYNCYVPIYGYTYTLTVLEPTPTPTTTVTPTNTPTPTTTTTPTNTPTPTPTPTTPLTLYYDTTPNCFTTNPFNNVVLDNDLCSASIITSTTVLPNGTYWITDGSVRRNITSSGGSYNFNGDCVGCA